MTCHPVFIVHSQGRMLKPQYGLNPPRGFPVGSPVGLSPLLARLTLQLPPQTRETGSSPWSLFPHGVRG
jgi:hypothetical protein